jgi:DNA-binding PadR family transcriptional regulator
LLTRILLEGPMPKESEEQTTANWMKEAHKGHIRVAALILINRAPAHGYEIMKEIKDKTGGFWSPTPGGVYPILRDLEKADYIKGAWQTQKNRKTKIYQITESGKQILKHTLLRQSEIANSINSLFEEFSRSVLSVEPTIFRTPALHPFSVFLEEEDIKTRDLKSLEQNRNKIQYMIQSLKEKLRSVNEGIAQIEKECNEKKEKSNV